MTFATGVIVANNYYAQPLEEAIAEAFHASSSEIGAVLTSSSWATRSGSPPWCPG